MAQSHSATEDDRWSLAEAVDLPIALEEERTSPGRTKDLAAARSELFVEGAGDRSHAEIIRAWLRRWQDKTGTCTPGRQLEDTLGNAGWLALIAGVIAGLATASDRLFFTGPEPLNVFAFIGVLVFAPLALSAILILTISLRNPGQGTALHHFFLFLGRKLVALRDRWTEHRQEPWGARASWNGITRSLGRNAELLQAPVLAITQKLALGFGIGLLIMLHLRVSFWELAFGWQSTLTAPESAWHTVTTIVASPWSWFWPEGAPTVSQIVATRYSRLVGATPIDPAMSRAWWPFLAATIIFWSIFARGVVLIGLRVAQNRRLRRFNPTIPDAELLLRRLLPGWSSESSSAADTEEAGNGAASVAQRAVPGTWHALIADEPDPAMPQEDDLQSLLGMTVDRVWPFQFDDSLAQSTHDALEAARVAGASLVVIVPASRDPIGEVSDTLRAVEKAVAGRGGLIVLRGASDRLALWKRKLGSWHITLPVEYLPVP